MTSAIPGYISWPVLTFFVLVLVFRLRWLGAGLAAHHRNRALIFVAATQLATEPALQHLLAAAIPLTAATTSQIPFALLLLISPELIGFIAMIDDTNPDALSRGYRQYRIATFVTIFMLFVVATGPRIRNQPIALAGDNSEVLAALLWSILSVTAAAMILRLLAANFHRPNKTVAERLIVVELIGLAGAICLPGLAIFTLALLDRLQLANTLEVRQTFYSHAIFYALLAVLPLALGPCFVAAQAVLHHDTNGSTWRKLQPLWTDLTTAYPDTVFNEPPQRFQPVTDFQLHRVIIEIRDALLQLAPRILDVTDNDRQRIAQACRPRAVDQSALQALQIANAIAHPASTGRSSTGSAPLAATATREDELAQLIDLATWWKTAKCIAEEDNQVSHARRADLYTFAMKESSNSEDLFQFFGGYFHQDWAMDAADWQGVVDNYVNEGPFPERIHAVAQEIDSLRTSRTESDLSRFLLDTVYLGYFPQTQTFTEWLGLVADRLRQKAAAIDKAGAP